MEKDDSVKAVVLASGKKGSWIAGANIKQIGEKQNTFKSEEEATTLVGVGQAVMNRVSDMQKCKPWIAAIDGACLGGGLEMAMTCSQRIATSSSKTVLGVPEVMLGLLPGWGGTQRLPKIVGASNALDMMLTGKMLKGGARQEDGLVDLVVDPNALERTAIATAEEFVAGTAKPKVRKLGWMDWFLEKTPPGRHLMFKKASEDGHEADARASTRRRSRSSSARRRGSRVDTPRAPRARPSSSALSRRPPSPSRSAASSTGRPSARRTLRQAVGGRADHRRARRRSHGRWHRAVLGVQGLPRAAQGPRLHRPRQGRELHLGQPRQEAQEAAHVSLRSRLHPR